ncbi:uncharacterized protein LOC110919377 [Helianthus annuus]|uniref:uncharacterized protein LOC110919377 n=1 Tax=Helianthus annuus TaxID=4232 RepID=UPI000B8FE77F|nr:uncharacterized protein LOC110919377 [Helianthus annuus]
MAINNAKVLHDQERHQRDYQAGLPYVEHSGWTDYPNLPHPQGPSDPTPHCPEAVGSSFIPIPYQPPPQGESSPLDNYRDMFERVVDGPNGLELKFLWIRLPSVAAEISELNILSDAIVRYEFGLGADKWAWILDSSGSFSVSSVKEKTHRLMFSDLRLDFEWNNWFPIKVNFLVWRLIQDKLPTKAALNRRNVIIEDNRCKMCGDEEESALHLFASCRIAEQIWEFITRWCRIKQVLVLELKDLANIHKCNRGSHRWKKTVNLVTQATIWVIWRSRNEAVFEGKQPYVNRMKEEIKMFGYMWLKSRVKNANISWENWCNFDLISLGV